ncbi:Flavocytochrome c [Hyaloraphidium curvatum]|nr:Flavocytochrome c [Hyaloraphidium curvatum]
MGNDNVANGAERRRTLAIVGGGLGGLAAVLSAYETLAAEPRPFPVDIVLLDKQKSVGGNSAKASSGFNAVRSAHQAENNITDAPDLFLKDTLAAGHGLCKPALVQILADESGAALSWLEGKSALALEKISRCGGHSVPRTHRLKEEGKPRAVGWELLRGLEKAARAIEADSESAKVTVKFLTGVRVVRLVADPAPPAAGARITSIDMPVDALVLSTGGYSRSPALLAKVPHTPGMPALDKLPTTNSPFTTGDGVHLALALHPDFVPVHMEHLQVHPTGFVDPKDPEAVTKMLAPEALRAHGGILVDSTGKRFTDELGRRDQVSDAIFSRLDVSRSTVGQHVFLILDGKGYADAGKATMDFYASRGVVRKFDTLAELAAGFGLPAGALESTVADYTSHARAGTPDEFGKKTYPTDLSEPPYLAAMITPVLHYSPGGIPFLATGELALPGGEVAVKGLFGAGEVTGGLHGGGRLAGNSLAECGVWGRRSGKAAAAALE